MKVKERLEKILTSKLSRKIQAISGEVLDRYSGSFLLNERIIPLGRYEVSKDDYRLFLVIEEGRNISKDHVSLRIVSTYGAFEIIGTLQKKAVTEAIKMYKMSSTRVDIPTVF